MREASLGYKHRIYFYMPVSGPSLITGCPCALSQAGCLGLLTVEERMLWLECCGVNSGEHSSQSWLIAGVCQPVKEIKWLLCVTWLQCYMPSHLPITRSFWKRSQTWNVGNIIIQLNVVALSHAILVYQECHTSKLPYQCHSTWSGWRWKVWKKVLSRRTPSQSCQRNNCFELLSTNAVVFFTQHLLIIFFWICKSHFLNAWVTPIINPSDVIGNPVVQSANLHSTMQQD